MDVGRRDERGEALMCLTVDAPVPPHVLTHIATEIEASRLRAITLPDVGPRPNARARLAHHEAADQDESHHRHGLTRTTASRPR